MHVTSHPKSCRCRRSCCHAETWLVPPERTRKYTHTHTNEHKCTRTAHYVRRLWQNARTRTEKVRRATLNNKSHTIFPQLASPGYGHTEPCRTLRLCNKQTNNQALSHTQTHKNTCTHSSSDNSEAFTHFCRRRCCRRPTGICRE